MTDRDEKGRFVKGNVPWDFGMKGKIKIKDGKFIEHLKNIGFQIGNIPWNKEKKDVYSKYANEKRRKANKGQSPWNKGKTGVYSKERIKRYKEWRKNLILPKKDTSIEVKIQDFLKLLHVEFMAHYYISEITHSYQCDILIPSTKTIIECDGDYFHGNPIFYSEEELSKKQKEQRQRDSIRTKELIEKGYKIIRLWEHDINKMELKDFKKKL